jgi:predicted flap endonuclease-1-like 5' DNA nuclease
MWQIASQMFLCLLLAGLIGAVAGWALAALLGRGLTARLEAATARVAALERDLAVATRQASDAEAARVRLAADLDGAMVRTQELELRRRSAEDRAGAAEAGLRVLTERGDAADVSLRAALGRASEAEAALREGGALREQADARWRAETVRAAHAEEAIRALEVRTAEELEQVRADRERLQASLRDALDRLQGLQGQFTSARERLEASLDTEAGERATLEQRLRQTLERVAMLEASHRALESGRDGAEARVRSLEDALRDGDGERLEVEARLQGLEGRLRAEQEAHQRAQVRILELTRLSEARPTRRRERGTRPPPPREGIVRRRAVRRPRRDDLKEIVGVGPVLERLLHRHGIHRFRQVALWTREDIRRIDAFLNDFHGRIRRDHWVRQARTLHRKRHGEAVARRTPRLGNGEPVQPSP